MTKASMCSNPVPAFELEPADSIYAPAEVPEAMMAPDFLEKAARHIRERAATRDQADGERTMGQITAAFNAIYGTALSEEMGWQFMTLLKMVRASNGQVLVDDYEDGSAYFALAGEAALKERS